MWHNLVVLVGWLEKKKKNWQNISKNPNDVMCHIFRLLCVNILVCSIVTSVVASVVASVHPWIRIKSPYLYYTKKYFICCLQLMVVCYYADF
jgi:hypothetical protein